MNSKLASLLKIWGLILSVGASTTTGSGVYAQVSSEVWTADQIKEKLNSTDRDWQNRVFKNLYLKDGKIIDNRGTASNDRDDIEVSTAEVMVRTVNGKSVYDLSQIVHTPVSNARLIEVKFADGRTLFDDGGVLFYDPVTKVFWYKAPGSINPVVVDGAFLNSNPDLRSKLEALGFQFQTGGNGNIVIMSPTGLNGISAGNIIWVPGTGTGYPNGTQGTVIGGVNGGNGSQSIIVGGTNGGPGAQGYVLGPGTIFGPGGTIIGGSGSTGGSSGNSSFNLAGGGGAAIVYSRRADIVDPDKTENYYEFEALGQKYMIASMVIPDGFFDWFNDEEVILRNAGDLDRDGQADWVLISQKEHEFLMRALNAETEKNKDILSKMNKYKVNKYDASDYDNVRKHAMKYKDAGEFGSFQVSQMPSGSYDGVVSIVGGGESGANGGGSNAIVTFINDFRAKNPNASLAELQAALDAQFGAGMVRLDQGADGNISVTILGAPGSNGSGSQVFVLGSNGQVISGHNPGSVALGDGFSPTVTATPISTSGVIVSAGSSDTSTSFKERMAKLRSKTSSDANPTAIASATPSSGVNGGGSSSTTTVIATHGVAPSVGPSNSDGGNASSSSSTTVTTISEMAVPSIVIGRDGIARIRIPIHLGEGVYKYEMYTLSPEEFARLQKNADGSYTLTDPALIEKINQMYGVKLNVLATAPGASSSVTTVTTGGSSPKQLHFEAANDEQLVKIVQELQKVYGDLKIYVTEVGGVFENSQGSTVGTFTKKLPQKVPYEEFEKKNLLNQK